MGIHAYCVSTDHDSGTAQFRVVHRLRFLSWSLLKHTRSCIYFILHEHEIDDCCGVYDYDDCKYAQRSSTKDQLEITSANGSISRGKVLVDLSSNRFDKGLRLRSHFLPLPDAFFLNLKRFSPQLFFILPLPSSSQKSLPRKISWEVSEVNPYACVQMQNS